MERKKSQEQVEGCRLLSLVDELLLCIIDQVDSHEALCNLAATCSRFQGLVEPYSWRSILVCRGSHASRIALALNNREERISFIQDLTIRYQHVHQAGIENLGGFMPHMDKLRHLTIESPCPNNGEWRHGFPFTSWTRIDYTTLFEAAVHPQIPPPSLPMLQSLTLHGHVSESRKFTFGRTAIIFFHPTLRNITISCSNFNAGTRLADIAPEKLKSTPLQSLKLIECNVNVPFLDVVLSLPRALKELSIGERLYVFDDEPSSERESRTSHPLFLDALQKQADSLEQLVHVAGNTRYIPPLQVDNQGAAKLHNLKSLQYLELGFESSLSFYLARDGCPDSLKTLRLTDHAWTFVLSYGSLQHVSIVMMNSADLVTKHIHKALDLDICFTYGGSHGGKPLDNLSQFWLDPDHQPNRKMVYNIAKTLKARGSRLRIFGETFDGGVSYIPPYMYGEETPKEVLVYDSERYWMFSGIDYRNLDDEGLQIDRAIVCDRCRLVEGRCVNKGVGTECLNCKDFGLPCQYLVQEDVHLQSDEDSFPEVGSIPL